MPTIIRSQTIRRPASEVFRVVADIPGFAEWNPTIQSSRLLSEGEVGDGTRFEFGIRGMGKQQLEVTRFERDRSIRFEPRSGMMDGGHLFTLSDDGQGTRLDHELVLRPKGVFRLCSPLMAMMAKRSLRKTADALQERVEGGSGEA